MKEQEMISPKLNLEISKFIEENENLLNENKNQKINFDNESMNELLLYDEIEKKMINNNNKCNYLFKIPFIISFFLLIVLFTFSIIFFYIIFFINNKSNFKIIDLPWIECDLNDREYQYYIFNNNLEVLLIHDSGFDMDGGAIVIESGYLDNPLNEGIASFATSLISLTSFYDSSNIPVLVDYFGNYAFGTDDFYTNFRFDILNLGFKKFLLPFGSILKERNWSFYFDEFYNNILKMINNVYNGRKKYIYYRENHLLEYFVYGFNNSNNTEILPEGNNETLSNYNYEELKKKNFGIY